MSALWQHDKRYESARQMLARIGIKFLVLFFILSMFDLFVDWVLELINVLIDLFVFFIETLEFWIEMFLEQSFHTDHIQNKTIIANGVLIIAPYVIYKLFRATPRLFVRFTRNILAIWLRYKRRESSYWRALSLTRKIVLVTSYFSGTLFILFLVTI